MRQAFEGRNMINPIELTKESENFKSKIWDKSRCPCGGIILADTENCTVPLCYECALEIVQSFGHQLFDEL